MGTSYPRRLCATVLFLLPGCPLSDDRLYGGGEVTVEVGSTDTQTWQIPGLGDDLSTRGRTISNIGEPSCEGGPGAWLWEDNGYPLVLWACGEGMRLAIDFGSGIEQGQTVSGWDSDSILLVHLNPDDPDEEYWLQSTAQATVRVGLKGLSGRFADESAEGINTGPDAIAVDWNMDPDTWVLK